MTFPLLFSSPTPVLVLAGCAAVALLALRSIPALRTSYGCVLQDVGRGSYGEFSFIAGVASAFVLAHGSALPYVVPVAVLTFADSLAALVGIRFGALRFKVPGGTKSLEGCVTFFSAAVACIGIPLGLAHYQDALPVAILTGAALMLVEALSWAGLDNFAIPVICGVLLRALAVGAT
jgi:phytol kinase